MAESCKVYNAVEGRPIIRGGLINSFAVLQELHIQAKTNITSYYITSHHITSLQLQLRLQLVQWRQELQ